MAQTVLITLTVAGLDTGPFDLYSNADAYAAPFETGISKVALVAGYLSTVVPDAATIIRVKSTSELCPNYIDLTITTTTTTTTSTTSTTTSTTSTSTSSTTTTTTTPFACADCRNWNYVSGNIPAEGDVIHWYSCVDGSPQSRALSFGDPDGDFCNCNSIGNPYSDNGTILTEIGICVTTTSTTTTAAPPATADISINNVSTDIPVTDVTVGGVSITYASGDNFPVGSGQSGLFTTTNVGNYTIRVYYGANSGGKITLTDSASVTSCVNVNPVGGMALFTSCTIDSITPVQIAVEDGTC